MRTIFILTLLAACTQQLGDSYLSMCVATQPTCAYELVFCSDGTWKMRFDGQVSEGTYVVGDNDEAIAEANDRSLGFTYSFSTEDIVSGFQQGTHWPATIAIQDGDVACAE